MTATEKLEEAAYNLSRLRQRDAYDSRLGFDLANFLYSARSVPYHLLADLNARYELDVAEADFEALERKAIRRKNAEALEAISWVDGAFNALEKDPEFGFLVGRRHEEAHKTAVHPDRVRIGGEPVEIPPGGSAQVDLERVLWEGDSRGDVRVYDAAGGVLANHKRPIYREWVFEEHRKHVGLEVCESYLEALGSLVHEFMARR